MIGGRSFGAAGRPHILGVVNVSPESPNQDSVVTGAEAAVERALSLTAAGAAIIDIGAQSSSYTAPLLPEAEETRRLLPALRALKDAGLLVSVDTWRAGVAQAAIEAGADLINDSDGFQDPAMIELLACWGGPVIVPAISGANPHDPLPLDRRQPVAAILRFFEAALARASRAGVHSLILDPGTGYRRPGVSAADKERYQVEVYHALPRLRGLGHPLLVAVPRKEDRRRTLALTRMILAEADFVRAHEPSLVCDALASDDGTEHNAQGGESG